MQEDTQGLAFRVFHLQFDSPRCCLEDLLRKKPSVVTCLSGKYQHYLKSNTRTEA